MKLCLRFASCFVMLGVAACSAMPSVPQVPQVPGAAQAPGAGQLPQMPGAGQLPNVPTDPKAALAAGLSKAGVPNLPNVPNAAAAAGALANAVPSASGSVAPASKPTGDTVDRAMKKVVAFSHEAEVREALESRPGEERADKTTAIVPRTMSPEERAAREKCRAADEKIMAKTAKLPVEKRFAMVKAHASLPENKPCADLRAQDFARFEARTTDVRARLHMFRLARGVAEAGQTCTRAVVWSKPICPEHPALDVDKDSAWACVAKHLTAADKESLGVPAYAYSYSVDARLGVFEIVARGCVADGTTTELVMRGRLGEKTDDLVIYRRKPST